MRAESRVARSLLLLALLAPAGPAAASPRTDPTAGRAVFTGAASVHPTSVLINPAALGFDAVVRWYAAITSVVDQEHVARRVEDEDGGLADGASLSDLRGAFGGELAFVRHPTQRISFGAALRSAPAETFFAADGAPYHARGGRQRDIAATVAGTLQVTSIFYIGAAISLGGLNLPFGEHSSYLPHHRLSLRFARDTALDGGSAGLAADCGGVRCGLGNPAATEYYNIEVEPSAVVSNQNLALTLGLALKLGRDTYLGLTYHTPPGFAVQSTLVGTATVTRAPRDGGEQVTGNATVDVSYPASVEFGLRTTLSEDLELVAGLRWEDTSRLSGYDVRPYGAALKEAHIPEWIRRARGLSDSFATWAGVEQLDGGQPWRFGARLGYELASIESSRISPGNNSTGSVTFDLGAQWRMSTTTSWSLQLGYGLAYFPRTTVDSSAYSARNLVTCVDSGYDYSSAECGAARTGYGLESAAGSYTRFQHALRFGLRYEY